MPSDEHNYLTAGTTTIRYLQEHYAGQHIYALATDSFLKECRHSGLQITTNARDKAITCVLVSYDSALTYEKIKDVCLLLTTRQVDYIATNPDLVCPVDFGYLPDCGAICNMIETATHRRPKFLGKPEPAMVQYALQAAGCAPGEALVVGDRLYTDIACGLRPGWTPPWCSAAKPPWPTRRPAPTSPPGFFPRWRSCGRPFCRMPPTSGRFSPCPLPILPPTHDRPIDKAPPPPRNSAAAGVWLYTKKFSGAPGAAPDR